MDTQSSYALITGASSGIGLAFARQLAAKGYALILVSNEEEKLSSIKHELIAAHLIDVVIIPMDLAQTDAPRALFEACISQNLEVEILINNAGFYFFGHAVQASPTQASQMVLLHIHTVSLLCTLFGNEMKKRRKGYILNNSSISAFKHFPGIAYYGSSKSYIKSFSRSLHIELKNDHVYVSCLCPGATETHLYKGKDIQNIQKAKKWGLVMHADEVARKGLKGMFNRQALIIPGIVNQITVLLFRVIPYAIIQLIHKYSKLIQ